MSENKVHKIKIHGRNFRPSMYVCIREDEWDYPHSIAMMTNRIVADWKFDEQCQKMRKNREFLKENRSGGGKHKSIWY